MEGTTTEPVKEPAATKAPASSETPAADEKKVAAETKSAATKVVVRKVEEEKTVDHGLEPRDPVEINLRTLLQAGVHFGHQTSRWNPAMSEYIYGSRNGIHIVNLPKSIESWAEARKAIVEVTSRGGSVLFVGTKKQAQDPVVEEAKRCGAFYVARRWLGGMITNFQTIRKSIARLNKVEEILAEEEKLKEQGLTSKYTKKERLMMDREREKLEFSLGGIRDMYSAPQLMFVIDIKREDIAIKEAQRLDIPVIALCDTNCDPSQVTHPIPSNDDGTRAIRLFASAVCDAVLEGKKVYALRGPERKETKINKFSQGRKSPKKGRGKGGPSKDGKPGAKGKVASKAKPKKTATDAKPAQPKAEAPKAEAAPKKVEAAAKVEAPKVEAKVEAKPETKSE